MESKMKKYSWGKVWKNSKGQWHRENDLPAIEYKDGYKEWYMNGKHHRELGPAIIYPNGKESWYLNGVYYSIENMPPFLYVNYLKWEYKKKNGI